MADREGQVLHARPGDWHYWVNDVALTKPFFYNATTFRDMLDKQSCRVERYTLTLVVACFPDDEHRGAIVLVPNRGLWWWSW